MLKIEQGRVSVEDSPTGSRPNPVLDGEAPVAAMNCRLPYRIYAQTWIQARTARRQGLSLPQTPAASPGRGEQLANIWPRPRRL